MPYIASASVNAGQAHRPGDAPNRNARGARHDQLAAGGEIAQAHQRADHRTDRQQLECLLRQLSSVNRNASACA
jgi:hypothetical protein